MNGRYGSIFDGRGGGPTPRQPGLRQHAPHHAVMDVQLPRDGADRPFLGVVEAQDLRLDVRWRHHGRVPSGRVVHSPLGDDRGDAKTLDGRVPGTADRTSDSAMIGRRGRSTGPLRRSRSPASRAPADHPVAAGVNRDASLFCRAPGSGASARHGRAVPGGWSGSAGRRTHCCGGGHAAAQSPAQ